MGLGCQAIQSEAQGPSCEPVYLGIDLGQKENKTTMQLKSRRECHGLIVD